LNACCLLDDARAEPLIDEIMIMSYEGFNCKDGSALLNGGELKDVHVRAALLTTVSDYPGTTPFHQGRLRAFIGSCKNCMTEGCSSRQDVITSSSHDNRTNETLTDEEYEVEKILSHRDHGNTGREYLVKWKRFDNKYNQWLTENDLQGSSLLVQAFNRANNISTSSSSSSSSSSSAAASSSKRKSSSNATRHTKKRKQTRSGKDVPADSDDMSVEAEEGDEEENRHEADTAQTSSESEEEEDEHSNEKKGKGRSTFFPGHYSFLPDNSDLRIKSKLAMNSNRNVNESRPANKTHADYIAYGGMIERETDPTERKRLEDTLGQKGLPAFHRLSGYYNVVHHTLNDFMHLFYNIILLIFEFIIRRHYSESRRKEFDKENRSVPIHNPDINDDSYIPIKQIYLKDKPNSKSKNRPPWQASNGSIRRLMEGSMFRHIPDNTSGNMDQPISFTEDGKPTLCIKGSADWIHMIGPIGVYYIYLLDIHPIYQEAFAGLLWWMYKLRRRYTHKQELDSTRSDSLPVIGRERLAVLEYLMPNHFCTILLHLLQHACDVLSFTGPPHGTWMFYFERWVQIAKGLLHSPFSAAEGLMRAVMTHEWLTFANYKTNDDVDRLLQPPLDRYERKPVVVFQGTTHRICMCHVFTLNVSPCV
jgi:hypothetical protein